MQYIKLGTPRDADPSVSSVTQSYIGTNYKTNILNRKDRTKLFQLIPWVDSMNLNTGRKAQAAMRKKFKKVVTGKIVPRKMRNVRYDI